MKKKVHRVLFVDDDPLILRGFRRSIDEYYDDWEVDFALSAQEALNKMAKQPFDVLVTDMHMPGMDGIQLLEVVSREMPEVIRFVLSGNTNDVQVLKSIRMVHQMIPKPCDMEKIYAIVKRACRLRDMLTDPHLLRIITGIKTLPSVPVLYNRLVKELESEDTSTLAVSNIIAQDTAMTAKILQLVNSAFFGLTDKVSSPQKAVTLLGLNTVKALVLGIQVFSEYKGRMGLPVSVDAIWKHSVLVSSLAHSIAKDLNLSAQEKEDVRVSGILHDIGILLYYKLPSVSPKVGFNKRGLISLDSEYQALGTSHAEMGGYLLGIWGLPPSIVEAVTFHHKPWLQDSKKANLVTALHIANALLSMCQFEKEAAYASYLDNNYLQQIGVADRLDEWLFDARELINQSGSFSGLIG
jgi:HD-like signal output (HDOD) protein/CheY-like chemotaxis protein